MSTLTPRDPAFFKSRYRVDVRTRHKVLSIDATAKTLQVQDLGSGRVFTDHYDMLVLATGASPIVPDISGIDRPQVFTLRNPRSALAIRSS